MPVSIAGFFYRAAVALMRLLSAKWQADTAAMVARQQRRRAQAPSEASAPNQENPARRSASLAARLATVSKLNSPMVRARLRPALTRTLSQPRPLHIAVAPKIAKQTIVLTTVAVRALLNKPARTAAVVDFPAAHTHKRTSALRKAA